MSDHDTSRRRLTVLATALGTLIVTAAVAIPIAITLTPAKQTTVAGQYVGVGGTTGSWWRGHLSGPAQLQQIGQTTVDLDRIQVLGPLRPKLELGPMVQTREADQLLDPGSGPKARAEAVHAITRAVTGWALDATGLLVLVALAVVTFVSLVRIWVMMGQAARHHEHPSVADVWHGHARQLRLCAVVALVGTVLAWAGTGALAWHDTRQGISGISSLRELVGAAPVHLGPVGHPVTGYSGAVIGDSRASRLGGTTVAHPTATARACRRSTDSLAAQLTRLDPTRPMLNLACPGATIPQGLLGAQTVGRTQVPAQVGRLLSMQGLQSVVVMIGPNDLDWTDFLRYCYGVKKCDDKFTSDQFDYRLASFDRDYGDLLASLAAIPSHPRVVIVGSYDVFDLDAHCADTRVKGAPGLSKDGIALLQERNDRLNDVLTKGAEAYGFDVARPHLTTLCQPVDAEVGPDIQGLSDRYPFHPTGIGMVRIAAPVLAALTGSHS